MKKMVLKLSIVDEKSKRRALKVIAGVQGVDSVAVDMEANTITVIGEADPIYLTAKLRKFGNTELLSVGPGKEEKKPEPPKLVYDYVPANYHYMPVMPVMHHDEYNDSCTIC